MYNKAWTDEDIIFELKSIQRMCETQMRFATAVKDNKLYDRYHDRWMSVEGMIYELTN